MRHDIRIPSRSVIEPSPFLRKGIYAPRLDYPAEFIYEFSAILRLRLYMGYLVGMVQYSPSLHPGLTQKDNICYPLFPLDEKGRYNRPQTVRHGDFLWGFMLDLMLLYLTFLLCLPIYYYKDRQSRA